MLFVRMLLTMVVSLYTSRVVLNALGVENFGIYNIVGGVVVMLGFLNNAMVTTTQRFLAFELGNIRRPKNLARVFSMSLNVHFFLALIIFLLAETIGIWIINDFLSIPNDRLHAANWVFQFSLFTLILTVISVPYNAVIIANERMEVFAWISFLEVGLKLFVVFVLQWFCFDKLIFYSILLLAVSVIVRSTYVLYCLRYFPSYKFLFFWNRELFQKMVSFASWNLWGNIAGVLSGQGLNMLLNVFFGPTVNAARGLSYQVRGALNGFVVNFQMAINPQIIKSYAQGQEKYMNELICQGSKFSFFLLFLLSIGVIFEAEFLLGLWLNIVPEFSVIFTRLVLIIVLIDSISGPLMTAAQASGSIRLYQSVVGGTQLFIVPISLLFLHYGSNPEVVFYVSIGISLISLFLRLYILKRLISFKVRYFYREVVLRILIVVFVTIIIAVMLDNHIENGKNFLILILVSLNAFIIILLFGITRSEKIFLYNRIKRLV